MLSATPAEGDEVARAFTSTLTVTFPDGAEAEATPRPDLGVRDLYMAVAGKQVGFFVLRCTAHGIALADVTEACTKLIRKRLQAFRDLDAFIRYGKVKAVAEAKEASALDFRAQHEAIPGIPAIEPVHGQLQAEGGGIANPVGRTHDTLSALHRSRAIDGQEYLVGRQFEATFREAGLDTMRAQDWRRIKADGARPFGITIAMVEARDTLYQFMGALGGMNAPIGMAAWHILGLGENIKEFSEHTAFKRGRPLRPAVATGLLIGALQILKGHIIVGNDERTNTAS